jgi:hypothetical protein
MFSESYDLSLVGALVVEQPLRVPPGGKSSEGRNFVAREKVRVAMVARSSQFVLFVLLVSRDFVHRRASPLLRMVCARIPGLCARFAHGSPDSEHGLRMNALN